MQNDSRLQSGSRTDIVGGMREELFLRSTPWVIDGHTPPPDSIVKLVSEDAGLLGQLAPRLRFSLVAILRDTWPQHLSRFILSVRCQSYQGWELWLVNDGSAPRAHLEIARQWAIHDPRIHLITGEGALGPSQARNLALARSTGDTLIVTDDDGVLHPMALGVFARHFNENPRINFIYTNEAEIDHPSTGLNNFVLKPSPDRFTLPRIPDIGRLYAVSRDLLERAARGGAVFRDEYDGIEEHDLWLRLALTDGFAPWHVPLFTYYHRTGSPARAGLTDSERVERRRRLAEEFAPRIDPGATWALDDSALSTPETLQPMALQPLADASNEATQLAVGPSLRAALGARASWTVRGVRRLRQPGALVNLGRRVLAPMPIAAKVGHFGVRQARRFSRRARLSSAVIRMLWREPGSLPLLILGLRHAGLEGLRQAIRVCLPSGGGVPPSPQEWFEATRPDAQLLAQFRRRRWPADAPRFTVVTPVYNVREDWLREAVESVIAQTYPHWEMICVNDHSTADHVRRTLDELAARDPRVKVVHCAINRGVSAATNFGLARATGDYVAFMDHDDHLEPHALHRFAEVVLRDHPDMIYSDEAVTDADINHIQQVACRPSFSYDYYLCCPFLVHLIAVRTEIVRRAGGLDEEMTVSQDIDFVLRVLEECRAIAQVAEVLYRWRTHPSSLGHEQRDRVCAMTRGALERHFERLGLSVEFDDKRRFNIRDVTFSLTAPARVAIIIPTKNPDDRLWKCVASLESTIPLELAEIVILDQSSGEGTTRTSLDKMAERHHQVLRFEGMAGASALLNQGATELRSATHYFFLHDDIEAIAPGWFEHMLGYAQRADVGIVGGTLAYPDGRIQHFGSVIGLNGTHGHVLKYAHLCVPGHGRCGGPNGIMLASRDVSAVTDACMLVRADVFDRLGGFDQKLDGRYHDLDLCLRARALGYKVIQDAYAVLCHEENEAGVAWPCRPHSRSQWRFFARHGRSLLAGDPFYSPMLSSSSTDMTLAPMARAAEAATFRTVPLVLPGRNNRPKPFRLDTASAFQPNVRLSRFVASIGQRDQQTSAV